MRTVLVASLLLLVALAAPAQVDTDFTASMKAANASFKVLQKDGDKTGVETVRSAERLGGIYEDMIAFWRGRNSAKGVEWSRQGKAAAVQLATAAHSGDATKAADAIQVISGTCRSCHEELRVRLPDGAYRIKSPPDPTAR